MMATDLNFTMDESRYILMSSTLFKPKLLDPRAFFIDKDIRCKRCLNIFFFNGCPHCGNTFIKRDILRQTS